MTEMMGGRVDPKFARLRGAFASCFADGLEHGAAVAVTVDGRLVADLWGGHADAAKTRPWTRDTLVNVWSTTKGVAALAFAMLVDRGKLRYEDAVAEAWPEFAANGKAAITFDTALSHQAGLHGVSSPMTLQGLYDWHPYAKALAEMAPLWAPGSRCVYHAISIGHLMGEPLRRVDGRTIGRFVAEEIAGPLDVPFFIGLPEREDHRVAELIEGPKASDWVTETLAGDYPQMISNPDVKATTPNSRAWRAAEIPGGNGHGDARALAAIYGELASGGGKLISKDGLAQATRLRFDGIDAASQMPACFGAGFALRDTSFGARPSRASFGHAGWGGTVAFADPEAKIGFAFVTSHMLGFDDSVDPRRERLIGAIYDAL